MVATADQERLVTLAAQNSIPVSTCRNCGARTGVYCTRGSLRYRRCPVCRDTFTTQEVRQGEVDFLLDMVDTAIEMAEGMNHA